MLAAGHARMGFRDESQNAAVSYSSLVALALPSILLQSGAPLAITVQTALLGHKATSILAAWAIVATATNAATVVFNFLVVGVTAKVSKVVGAKAWSQIGARIRLALTSALVMGVVAALLLAAIKPWLFILLEDSPEARGPAEEYFYLRVLGVLPQLLAMCTSGILQGYKRVYLVAAIQVARLCIDVLASYLALYVFDFGIWGVGIGNVLASSCSTLLAFTCIVLLPPSEGKGRIHIFRPLRTGNSAGGRSCGTLFPGWHSAGGQPGSPPLFKSWKKASRVPLLDDATGDDAHKQAGMVPRAGGEPALYDGGPPHWLEDSDDEDMNGADGHVLDEPMWKFVWDGLSTMLRSALVQLSFFLVLAAVTALGVHAVAAHQVVMQLWMITVYVADGFATAGTIVGSDLTGKIDKSHNQAHRDAYIQDLRTLAARVLLMGTAAGVIIGLLYWFLEAHVMAVFTDDPLTKEELRRVWLFLVCIQPLNAIVFVYDGLIYAAQAFSYMALCLSVGFVVVFLPVIGLAHYQFKTLLAAWMSKGALNIVRLVVASYKIHVEFLNPPAFPAPLTEVITATHEPVLTDQLSGGEDLDLPVLELPLP